MRRDLEGPIHRSILAYLRLTFPAAIVHHSPNEVPLAGKNVARAISKAKWNGMVTGFPDIVVFPYSNIGPLFFEVKADKGTATEAQEAVIGQLQALGYHAAVVRSIDDVAARLAEWGVWSTPAVAIPHRGTIE